MNDPLVASTAPDSYRRDLPAAFRALRKLLADNQDTTQVFLIMRALNGPSVRTNFFRLLKTVTGQTQAYRRVELAKRFADAATIASFAPGTVGAAYRTFLQDTGYSAQGLAEISSVNRAINAETPFAWMGRRTRDVHDIWHLLTGYRADETLGEAALVAFSFAQTGGWGWALIALATAFKSMRVTRTTVFARAVLEGYRHGRRAAWLLGEDYEALLQEPLADARTRLGIAQPVAYRTAQQRLAGLVIT